MGVFAETESVGRVGPVSSVPNDGSAPNSDSTAELRSHPKVHLCIGVVNVIVEFVEDFQLGLVFLSLSRSVNRYLRETTPSPLRNIRFPLLVDQPLPRKPLLFVGSLCMSFAQWNDYSLILEEDDNALSDAFPNVMRLFLRSRCVYSGTMFGDRHLAQFRSRLEHLEIEGGGIDISNSMISECKKLKVLRFVDQAMSRGFKDESVFGLEQLEVLGLVGKHFTNAALSLKPKLKHLELFRCSRVTDDAFEKGKLSNLRVLCLDECPSISERAFWKRTSLRKVVVGEGCSPELTVRSIKNAICGKRTYHDSLEAFLHEAELIEDEDEEEGGDSDAGVEVIVAPARPPPPPPPVDESLPRRVVKETYTDHRPRDVDGSYFM